MRDVDPIIVNADLFLFLNNTPCIGDFHLLSHWQESTQKLISNAHPAFIGSAKCTYHWECYLPKTV